MTYTKSQQLLLDDGCPEFLIITPEREEQRRLAREKLLLEGWRGGSAQPVPIFGATVPAPKPVAPETEETKIKKAVDANRFKARVARAAQRKERLPGSVWDTRTCRWVHPAAELQQKKEDIMAKLNGQKTVAELTAEYNEWAAKNGKKLVKKFKDRATAEARLASIGKSTAEPKSPKVEVPQNGGSFNGSDVVNMFKFRAGSDREKLVKVLAANMGRQVTMKQIGSLDKFDSAVAGVLWRIDQSKLPYSLRVVKEKEGKTYGLHQREVLPK